VDSHFEQFRELVLREPELQRELREPEDFSTFLPVVLQLARERGYPVAAEEVESAWRAAQRAWIERWI